MTDSQLEARVKKAIDRTCDNVHMTLHEPSLALCRVHEHVCRTMPSLVERRQVARHRHQRTCGALHDIDYCISAVKAMGDASVVLANTGELLKEALFYRQQLTYEEHRHNRLGAGGMYRRLSRFSSDLHDLDLVDTWRDTSNRLESVWSQARHSLGDSP